MREHNVEFASSQYEDDAWKTSYLKLLQYRPHLKDSDTFKRLDTAVAMEKGMESTELKAYEGTVNGISCVIYVDEERHDVNCSTLFQDA